MVRRRFATIVAFGVLVAGCGDVLQGVGDLSEAVVNSDRPTTTTTQPAPDEQTVLVDPQIWANTTDEGMAQLKAAADPSLSPEWPVSISIPDWTTYSKEQIVACKGPGE